MPVDVDTVAQMKEIIAGGSVSDGDSQSESNMSGMMAARGEGLINGTSSTPTYSPMRRADESLLSSIEKQRYSMMVSSIWFMCMDICHCLYF